jgi:hypothetical protein
VILCRLGFSIESVQWIFGVALLSGMLGDLTLEKCQSVLGSMAQLGWLCSLHYGIRSIGLTLDMYGLEFNKKNQSSNFNIESP